MQKNRVVSLLPLVLLLGTALFLHGENSAEFFPDSDRRDDDEIARILDAMTQDAPALKPELKRALLRYRTLEGEARRVATQKHAWEAWRDQKFGETIESRLRTLRRWKDFSLETPQRRASGQIEVGLVHGDERLKAWLVSEEGQWKLSGLVTPH